MIFHKMIRPRQALLALAAIALASCAAARPPLPACPGGVSPAADEVPAARAAFNQAIAGKDIDAIARLLAPGVTLVTGTDSTLFNGRDAQLSIWAEDFEAAERAVYVRTTGCVSVSPVIPVAFETGTWRGERTDDPHSFAAGVYSAKWRKTADAWQLEAEIFATEDCGGSFCPQEPAP